VVTTICNNHVSEYIFDLTKYKIQNNRATLAALFGSLSSEANNVNTIRSITAFSNGQIVAEVGFIAMPKCAIDFRFIIIFKDNVMK
jgi:hypothetical protein